MARDVAQALTMEASRPPGKPPSRVKQGQIRVGQPLAFDAYDEAGRLLLKRGSIVHSDAQIERLLEQGLYTEPAPQTPVSSGAWRPAVKRLSAIGLLQDVFDGLRSPLEAPESAPAFEASVRAAVLQIQRVCRLDPDAALGSLVSMGGSFYPVRHVLNCATLAALVMKRLQFDAAEATSTLAGILTMNVAMVDLQHALYMQQAAPDDAQKAAIRAHPHASAARLRGLNIGDATWLATVEGHHELVDGSGYPLGLRDEAVARPARVAALVDQYCALVSERAHRHGVNPVIVIRKLAEAPQRSFDAAVFDAMRRELGIYPPGSIVQLANGETAIVWRRTQTVEQPIVLSFLPERGARYEAPRKRHTSKTPYAIVKPLPMSALSPYPPGAAIWEEAFEPEAAPPAPA